MARPTKQGIDYFPIDCQFDDKIEMYVIEKGAAGIAVLLTIWQMMYSNNGYFIENTKDTHLIIKKRIDVGINEIDDCINVCLSREIFNKNIHRKYKILTSRGVQKRFFDAAKKKKVVNAITEYMLICVDSCDNIIYSSINNIDANGNATKVEVEVEVEVEEKEIPYFIDRELWDDFIKMRRSIKAPMTDRAELLAIGKLQKFHESGHDVNVIIGEAIIGNWKSFYPPKENNPKKSTPVGVYAGVK